MGKIVATYHIKVTLREPDPVGIEVPPDGTESAEVVSEAPADPPTITTVEQGVAALFSIGGLVANATAERTDR